jgi:hypothetical protein
MRFRIQEQPRWEAAPRYYVQRQLTLFGRGLWWVDANPSEFEYAVYDTMEQAERYVAQRLFEIEQMRPRTVKLFG